MLVLRYGSNRDDYSTGDYSTPNARAGASAREIYEDSVFTLDEVVKSVLFQTSDETDSEIYAEMALENRTNEFSSWFKKWGSKILST